MLGVFQRQVCGSFLFLNTKPLPPTSLEGGGEFSRENLDRPKSIKIDQNRSKSTKNDQNRPPTPPPKFLRELLARFTAKAGKGRAAYGPKMERHPPPMCPNSEDSALFFLFFFGGGGGSKIKFLCSRERELFQTPPYRKNSSDHSPEPVHVVGGGRVDWTWVHWLF